MNRFVEEDNPQGSNMSPWGKGVRDDPIACDEQNRGKFEITTRDGCARLGKLHTEHGIIETPTLLPVINPNIRTIEPRKMWDRYGIQILITNSYVIWKNDELKKKALSDGVHELLDFPGAVMTDSGTFQSYVYGDVEVGVEEIVEFQKAIGVDIATMLDVFTRPDMKKTEVEEAVIETIKRSEVSIAAADSMMLNGPIQGGIHHDLRKKSVEGMKDYPFAIHPIGGIVPIMESQQYTTLAKIMLATKPNLPSGRPVHMFGCGHPMLFPMLIALGADLFDSAAYALFARDGRLLCPWGTEKIDDMVEWPVLMPCVAEFTPEQVRKMDENERNELLSTYNLEITLAELSRCRQAIRDGNIWHLAEKRSHEHPALRQAWLWLTTAPQPSEQRGEWEDAWDWIVDSQKSPRTGSVKWGGEDTHFRPHVQKARRRIQQRWRSQCKGDVIIFHGTPGPWREKCGAIVRDMLEQRPDFEVMVLTPLGLIPWTLEDLNPFAQLEGPTWIWNRALEPSWIKRELSRLGLDDRTYHAFDLKEENLWKRLDEKFNLGTRISVNPNAARIRQSEDKLRVLLNMDVDLEGADFNLSSSGRIRNIITKEGVHIASPRLTDGGMSLTMDGAKLAFENGDGPARITVTEDAVPFVKKGRNVIHGFITQPDENLMPDEACLILNPSGELIAHGISRVDSEGAFSIRRGIAVRVKGSIGDN